MAGKELMVVGARVKKFLKEKGLDCRLQGDFLDQLNAEVEALVSKATTRASGNKRKTLKPCDL